jgi:chromosome segregation ATPase
MKIGSMKKEHMQVELDMKKLESVKADLEYNLRSSEYNVEILKNQIENLNTELTLLKK